MILSKIENVKQEQKLINDSTADNLQVSPAIGNTNVSSRLLCLICSRDTGLTKKDLGDGCLRVCSEKCSDELILIRRRDL